MQSGSRSASDVMSCSAEITLLNVRADPIVGEFQVYIRASQLFPFVHEICRSQRNIKILPAIRESL